MRLFLLLLTAIFLGCSSTTPIKEDSYHYRYIDNSYLKTVDFSKNSLQTIRIGEDWYYIREDGRMMLTLTDSEGKAERFKEGLARTKIGGKIGFFNKTLDIVLKPIYDFAFPFYDGVAEICIGCREIFNENQKMLDGGEWKRIDRTGLILEE
jgi:hypothetical protein